MGIKTKTAVEMILHAARVAEREENFRLAPVAKECYELRQKCEALESAVAKGVNESIAPSVMAERKRCLQIVMLQFGSDCFHTPAKQAGFDKTYQDLLDCIMRSINSGEAFNG